MIQRLFTCLALCVALTTGMNAQTEVSTYQPGITTDGITYFLPQTRLLVTVTATKTTHTPGEYARFARNFLRINDAPLEAYDEWAITSVSITSYGVPDKSESYTIRLKSKTSAPLVGLSPDGLLLSVNTSAPEIAPLPTPSVTQVYSSPKFSPADYKTAEILSAGSTTKMAELTAEEIYDIRENRSLLTKGQADFMPKDGEQLKLMLAKLDEQEEALLQLFKGTTSTETHTMTFSYAPDEETERDVLFRFSPALGPLAADDLSGAPVYISVKDLHSLPAVQPTTDSSKKKEVEDLRYIVPGKAQVNIFTAEQNLLETTVPLAQFGRVEHLGGDLFNKKYTIRVTLYPETGGIRRIDADEPL